MRVMQRNKRTVYYCLFKEVTPIKDADGYDTGEKLVLYSSPVKMLVNINPAQGLTTLNTYGVAENYTHIMITDDMSCPIDTNTVLFVDKEPSYGTSGEPLYDYIVTRVAKSLNSIKYELRKIE